MTKDIYYIKWEEIFNLPKHKHLEDESPENILRIPNHVFMKMEVK